MLNKALFENMYARNFFLRAPTLVDYTCEWYGNKNGNCIVMEKLIKMTRFWHPRWIDGVSQGFRAKNVQKLLITPSINGLRNRLLLTTSSMKTFLRIIKNVAVNSISAINISDNFRNFLPNYNISSKKPIKEKTNKTSQL